jgi:ectoine hydroxylase-related dioxygenase (phytanoyl-CoA dioxygenase family)
MSTATLTRTATPSTSAAIADRDAENAHPFALDEAQVAAYDRDGFVVVPGLFSAGECAAYRDRQDDLRHGRLTIEGFFQQEKYGERSFNQHRYDAVCRSWLIAPRLHRPLAQLLGEEPDAVQTMHFFHGSEHPLHQDQYYLPGCIGAWIALEEVDADNGPLVVMPGSHRRRLVTPDVLPSTAGLSYDEHQERHYFPAVADLAKNHLATLRGVPMHTGDVLLFHGRLIHGGAKVNDAARTRHALACHYIPYHDSRWTREWPRVSFSGRERW